MKKKNRSLKVLHTVLIFQGLTFPQKWNVQRVRFPENGTLMCEETVGIENNFKIDLLCMY